MRKGPGRGAMVEEDREEGGRKEESGKYMLSPKARYLFGLLTFLQVNVRLTPSGHPLLVGWAEMVKVSPPGNTLTQGVQGGAR